MNLDLTYTRIKSADTRCKEIIKELETANDCSFPSENIDNLNEEYEQFIIFIINQCNAILESDQYEDTDEDMMYRIRLEEFQSYYKELYDGLENKTDSPN